MIDKNIDIWRAKFNTGAVQSGNKKASEVFEYCYKQEIVGLGWKLGNNPKTIDEAILEGKNYKKSFKNNMNELKSCNIDHLVWALGEHAYYIGRICTEYEYKNTKESDEFDVHNTKGCKFFKVGEIENVPGAIVSSFYGRGQTFRRVKDNPEKTIENISKLIYNKVSNEEYYKVNFKKNIWLLFSDQEIEEIVSLYLQFEKGYKVYITTKRKSTKKYEFTMVNEKGEKATVQVKSGDASLDYKEYLNDEYKVFLFASCEKYGGEPNNKKIKIIPKGELEEFIYKRKDILPQYIQYWIDL